MLTYEIRQGDTLFLVAQRFGITVQDILLYNQIPNPDRIDVGLVIRLPVDILPPTVPSPLPVRNIASRCADGMLLTLLVDRMFYLRNQPVGLTLVKTNISGRPITLNYLSSQRYDFIIYQDGLEVWRWSAGQVFLPVLQQVTLAPGQSQVFSAVWNQATPAGLPVPPGVYRAVAINTASELRDQPVSTRFRIAAL